MATDNLIVLGCDPGGTGALCVLSKTWVKCFRFTEKKFEYEAAVEFVSYYKNSRIVPGIERVGSRKGNSMQSVFSFGVNTGMAFYMFHRMGFRRRDIATVEPKTWQLDYGLGWKYKNTTERKNAHVAKAREIWPSHIITQEEADAWLIARYFWNQELGL